MRRRVIWGNRPLLSRCLRCREADNEQTHTRMERGSESRSALKEEKQAGRVETEGCVGPVGGYGGLLCGGDLEQGSEGG